MSDVLPIMECYSTFQGEGYHAGLAAWFVRLQGCNVGCVWCDVKESWEMDVSKNRNIHELLELLESKAIKNVVITGGEPTLFDLRPFCDLLHSQGYTVHIETAGTEEIMGDIDWITLSPKKFKPALDDNFQIANELKVVIYHPSDLDWAAEMQDKVTSDCRLYLQPEWSKQEQRIPDILEYIQNHPQWSLSLQTHKYVQQP